LDVGTVSPEPTIYTNAGKLKITVYQNFSEKQDGAPEDIGTHIASLKYLFHLSATKSLVVCGLLRLRCVSRPLTQYYGNLVHLNKG